MNYLDLFSGIGGFHLGLKWAGFKFDKVYYSDIDDYANKVYAKNFPDAIPLGDITKIDATKLPKIDIVTGGFPCQDISVAGKQKGITGERSGLFYEIIRLCSVLRPGIMFLENVPNLITGGNGLWFKSIIGSIAEIGYAAEWQIIQANWFRKPHKRHRIFIVAYPKRRGLEKFPNRRGKIESIFKEWASNALAAHLTAKRIYGLPNTEINRGISRIPRRVDRLKCLGNAVVPQVVQLIGEMILESGILNEHT